MPLDRGTAERYKYVSSAGVAQLVEPHVANVAVAGSNPVSCSFLFYGGPAAVSCNPYLPQCYRSGKESAVYRK